MEAVEKRSDLFRERTVLRIVHERWKNYPLLEHILLEELNHLDLPRPQEARALLAAIDAFLETARPTATNTDIAAAMYEQRRIQRREYPPHRYPCDLSLRVVLTDALDAMGHPMDASRVMTLKNSVGRFCDLMRHVAEVRRAAAA